MAHERIAKIIRGCKEQERIKSKEKNVDQIHVVSVKCLLELGIQVGNVLPVNPMSVRHKIGKVVDQTIVLICKSSLVTANVKTVHLGPDQMVN